MQKEHQVVKQRREDFDDNHDEVHTELERQLSRMNPLSSQMWTDIEHSHHPPPSSGKYSGNVSDDQYVIWLQPDRLCAYPADAQLEST